MARPRTPLAKAKITGRDIHDKKRFDGRNAPVVKDGIGEPPDWLKPFAKAAWIDLVDEIPWLNKSHRTLLSIAATVRGRMMGDSGEEVGVQAMNLLRQALGQMGATPADSTRIGVASDGDEKEPGEEFFDR